MLGPWWVEPHQQMAQHTRERPQLYIVYMDMSIHKQRDNTWGIDILTCSLQSD